MPVAIAMMFLSTPPISRAEEVLVAVDAEAPAEWNSGCSAQATAVVGRGDDRRGGEPVEDLTREVRARRAGRRGGPGGPRR